MSAQMCGEAARQQALLAALQGPGPVEAGALATWLVPLPGPRGQATALEGVAAYRRHADALAARALAAVHPVLQRLLGEAALDQLARHLWREHPPQDGDLANWGAALPDLLLRLPEFDAMPWLAEVARLEWALHCAAGAADVNPTTPAGLHHLGVADPDQLRLRCRPGTQVLLAKGPLWTLWHAHQQPPTDAQLADLRRSLDAGSCEPVLVHRAGWHAVASPMTPADAAFTLALINGCSLGHALRQHPPADFEPWLLRALRERWLLGIEPSSPLSTTAKDWP